MSRLRGILFDKDGTLFDFQKTWGGFTAQMIREEAGGSRDLIDRFAQALGFDMAAERFHPSSIVIAGTSAQVAEALEVAAPGLDIDGVLGRLRTGSANATQVPVCDLPALFDDLRGRGLRLGIATNDAETPARANIAQAGVEDRFEFIAGFDSGFGAKPETGQLIAFSEAVGLPPRDIAMVGDSTHDLHAGAAAGMLPIAVLTGVAPREELAPHAEVVLRHIGELPAWLDASA